QRQPPGESCPDPEGVGGFDEHAIRADIAGLSTQNRGAPLNLELGAKGITRRTAAFQMPRRMHNAGHRPQPPAKNPKLRRRGLHAAFIGQEYRDSVLWRTRREASCCVFVTYHFS